MDTKGRNGKSLKFRTVVFGLIIALSLLTLLVYINAYYGDLDPSSAIDFWSVKTCLMLEGHDYSDAATCAVCIASHF